MDTPRVDREYITFLIEELILTLGDDPERPGLRDTPDRVARMWADFIDYDPGNHETTFEVEGTDQMIVVSPIRVWSFCEHHLLPFWADVSIGYIAQGKVLGLSKFARIAHKHAHRLQIQERLVEDIARNIQQVTASDNVAVLARGEHLCMTMRGIKTESRMIASAMHGVFLTKPEARAEFLSLVTLAQGKG